MRFLDIDNYLQRNLPNCPKDKRARRALCKVLSNPNRHYDDHNAMALSKSYAERIGTSPSGMKRHLTNTGLFSFDPHYRAGRCQRAYPTDAYYEIVGGLFGQRFPLVDVSTEIEQPLQHETIVRDGVRIMGNLPVDHDALADYRAVCFNSTTRKDQYWATRASLFSAHINSGIPGKLPQDFYREPKTHRLTASLVCLQNIDRELRKALLNGYHMHDITNCFYTILANWTSAPHICDYALEPASIRYDLAAHCNCSEDGVKAALLALIFGAKKSYSPFESIPHHLNRKRGVLTRDTGKFGRLTNDEKERVNLFFSHPFVRSLQAETRTVRHTVFQCNDPQSFSHLLMQEEQRIMRALMKNLTVSTVIHDGFATTETLDPDQLQQKAYQDTGYSIKVKTETIAHQFSTSQDQRGTLDNAGLTAA